MTHFFKHAILLSACEASPILLEQDIRKPDKDPAFDRQSVRICGALKEIYAEIAGRLGNLFPAAPDVAAACVFHPADFPDL